MVTDFRHRGEPVDGDTGPDHVVMQIGPGQRRRGVRQMPQRPQSGLPSHLVGLIEVPDLLLDDRVPRVVGMRQVRPDPDNLNTRGRHSGTDHGGPFSAVGATTGQPGIDLEVYPGDAPGRCRGGCCQIELAGGVDAEIDLGGDAGSEVLTGSVQPGQYRSIDSAVTERERLVDAAHAERTGPGLQRGDGNVHRTVAVTVGLDHCHRDSPGRGGTPGEDSDVVPDRIKIDHQLRPRPGDLRCGHPRLPAADRRARIASLRAVWIAEAGAGAPPPCGPPPSAAMAAANSWACTAAAAAVAGCSPAASNAPSTPVRTSPEPAVAGQDERARFTSTWPSGAAMMVVFPLSTSTASNRRAASRAAPTRSGPGALPVRRSNSRSCGVRTSGVSGSRLSVSSGGRASRVIASASATTGTPAASTWANTR